MAEIIESAEYGNIRALLGVPDTILPDATIELFVFLPFVLGEVKELFPTWEAILAADDQDTKRLKVGAAAWAAARLCDFIEREESQSFRIDTYQQSPNKVDWRAKAEELADQSAGAFAAISSVGTASRMTLMKVDGPTRSETNLPSTFSGWLDKIEPTVIDWMEDEDE